MFNVQKVTFLFLTLTLIFLVKIVRLEAIKDDEFVKVGDMLLTEDQAKLLEDPSLARNAFEKSDYRWPLNIVPVVFSAYDIKDEDHDLNEKFIERFKSAAAEISKHSCIEFHFFNESTYEKGRYPRVLEVYIHTFAFCETTVGYHIGGRRAVKISRNEENCNKEDIIHILIHVLGFFHMNNSPDRDQYVTIDWGNVGYVNLKLLQTIGVRVNRLGTAYDYNSMMHDGPYFGSKEPGKLKTIIPKAPHGNTEYGSPEHMGERKEITKGDAVRIRLMYDCDNPYGFPGKTPQWPFAPGRV